MWSSLLALAGLIATAAAAAVTPRQDGTFTNPVLYEDFPDNDVSLGPDGYYYFSASNFHYSPGAPILRSLDLVNWEFVGHSIPRLTFGDAYDLVPDGERAYRGGTWASTLRYRESNGLWYWIGCTNFWNTWIFTAESVEGPWEKSAQLESGLCYYDLGLLIDDTDTMYVSYASGEIHVAQLAADGLSQVRNENVFNASDAGAESMEGNRMYQINGLYYILNDQPGGTTYIWKSESPWGPYEYKILVENITPPLEGGSSPHQGSLIQTSEGDWYYMSFTWAYPAGRLPVLAPITWGDDGFPVFVEGGNGGWGTEYPLPLPEQPLESWTNLTYTFAELTSLPVQFEWNHNPDDESWGLTEAGLTLHTATVTDDLYSARNTLTHRIHGEFPVGTAEIDFTNMADGDIFGLAAFRDRTSYIGVRRAGTEYTLTALHNATLDEWGSEGTIDMGSVVAEEALPEGTSKIWLRAELDARPTGTREAVFSYSLDGAEWTVFGDSYELYSGWAFFIAYRFGILNFATEALGGSIDVVSFSTS